MTVRGEKREAILEAALQLFNERGFHGTSVPELARRAEVATGTLYRYFDSKEAIVNALYQEGKAQLTQAVAEAMMSESSWRGRFRALWEGLFRFDRQHPGMIPFLELQHHADYLDATSRALSDGSAQGLFALVAGGQADEAFAELEPAAVIALVYGAFLGLLRAEREGWLTLSPELVERAEVQAWALIRR